MFADGSACPMTNKNLFGDSQDLTGLNLIRIAELVAICFKNLVVVGRLPVKLLRNFGERIS